MREHKTITQAEADERKRMLTQMRFNNDLIYAKRTWPTYTTAQQMVNHLTLIDQVHQENESILIELTGLKGKLGA